MERCLDNIPDEIEYQIQVLAGAMMLAEIVDLDIPNVTIGRHHQSSIYLDVPTASSHGIRYSDSFRKYIEKCLSRLDENVEDLRACTIAPLIDAQFRELAGRPLQAYSWRIGVTQALQFDRYVIQNHEPLRLFLTRIPLAEHIFGIEKLFSVLHELSDKLLAFGNRYTYTKDVFKSYDVVAVDSFMDRIIGAGNVHQIFLFDYVHVIGTKLNELSMRSSSHKKAQAVNDGVVRDLKRRRRGSQRDVVGYDGTTRYLSGSVDFLKEERLYLYVG